MAATRRLLTLAACIGACTAVHISPVRLVRWGIESLGEWVGMCRGNLFFQGAFAIPTKPSSMEGRWCSCGEFPLSLSILSSSMLVCTAAACERPMESVPDLAFRSSQASMRLRGGFTSWSDSPATSRLRDLAKSPYDLTQNDAITPGRISTMQVCPNASHRLAHRSSAALSVSTVSELSVLC